MLFNYLKIAVRLLTRNKLVSIINISGLALALTGCLLITLFIRDELRYDRYHEHADHIYRVTRNFLRPDGSEHMHLGHLAPPFGPLLKNDFPDILESTRTAGPVRSVLPGVPEEGGESNNYEIENGYFVEPSVFTIFSIDILSGNTTTSLEKPLTMMLSDKVAQQYFGDHADIVGKEVRMFDRIIEITGTYKAFPAQSHWHPDVLISFSTLHDKEFFGLEALQNKWEENSFLTYILVNDAFDPVRTEQLFPSFIDKHMPAGDDPRKKSSSTKLFLQPLTSIHLHSHLDSEAETNGNINHVYAMESIGLFLIIIACFNFINLSTARATQRGKEVGLRKVSGALRTQLIFQYISESTLITLLAMIVAVAIASACLPWLNNFTGKSINLQDYLNFNTIIILTGFVMAVGAMAGLYPAFVISGFKPARILKGQTGSMRDGSGIRKALVVMQFSISIVMIIATLITYQQLEFLGDKDLGYSKDQIVTFRYEQDEHYDAFYNYMTEHPAIVSVTMSNFIPTSRLLSTNNIEQVDRPAEASVIMKNVSIDQNFFAAYNIPLVSGKNFSTTASNDGSFMARLANGFILNESACTLLGWTHDEAIGKELSNGGAKATVIGVVKDFHFESLHEPIAPIIFNNYKNYSHVSVLVSTPQMKEAVAHLEKAWKKFVKQEPLKYGFLSDRYNRLYESEASQRELFIIFAVVAVFIASLGLFGLATFNTIQRSKEVCIRKVLGASVQSLLQLLSKEIIILIVLANAVAWPIAWYFMKEWLGGFAYHIEMDILTYIGAGALTLVITLLTISTQTLKAALTNPATMLRNE
jgi:putative ABC transport system permease protein